LRRAARIVHRWAMSERCWYGQPAVERAMKVQEVILRAMSGAISWSQASDVLRMRPRTLRRWRWRMERFGVQGLFDRRRRQPSPRRVPLQELERVLRLYRERYEKFNVRHFYGIACREHGVTISYSTIKTALQAAGLVRKYKSRGRHRLRREPRASFGEMLHIDGSLHRWLALSPDEQQTLIAVVDDATSRLLYAQLADEESTATIMAALRAVIESFGLPASLYSDRASWAAVTPRAGGRVDRSKRTQVGRALDQLGIEQILAYSPQARGRGERVNRTAQGRLVNELRVAGVRTLAAANRYLIERYVPQHNAEFARAPRSTESAFVPLGSASLDRILSHCEPRVVGKDNTVSLDGVRMQIAKQTGRRSCEGLHVTVHRHLDGSHSVWAGTRELGRFQRDGRSQSQSKAA
jgi:transposase